jgi:hypothetical protein
LLRAIGLDEVTGVDAAPSLEPGLLES